jgi:hypothetical protein
MVFVGLTTAALPLVAASPALASTGAGSSFCSAYGGLSSSQVQLDNVYPCANPNISDGFGYQCVEYSVRFESVVYGIPSSWAGGPGWNVVNELHQHGVPANSPNGSSGGSSAGSNLPTPGDVISMWGPNQDPAGHTGVVEAVKVSNGTGSITYYDENGWQSNGVSRGYDVISVSPSGWSDNMGSSFDYTVFNWTVQGNSTPTAASAIIPTSDGHIQVFSDANGTLQENWYDPATGHVGGGSSVAGMTVQGTSALVARSGQSVIDAFVRNSAGQIVETWYNWGTGQWGGWITVNGGTFASDPSAAATSDGHDQVFATASSGTLAMNWFDPGSGRIGGGSSVAGMTVQGTSALVARSGQSVIDAFVRNSAGQIVETWYNWGTGQWGGWITISGATLTSSPEAVATSDGHDQIFAVNNGSIEQNWFAPSTGQIGNWVTI